MSKPCHTRDEGRPLEAAMQVEASNRLKVLWSKAMVGTWESYDFDVKGEPASGRPARGRVPMRNIGAEGLVVVMKLL